MLYVVRQFRILVESSTVYFFVVVFPHGSTGRNNVIDHELRYRVVLVYAVITWVLIIRKITFESLSVSIVVLMYIM